MFENKPTILVIDNDEGMVAALTARLGSLGYHCVTAGTGAQGIAAFREQTIHLVISDLNMPAGDGITLARTIRESSNVPIIVVTGFQDEFRRELRSIPNVTLLQKPFEYTRLVELIEADLVLSGNANSDGE